MLNDGLDEPDGGKSLDMGHVVLEEGLPPPARLVQDHVTRGGQGRGSAGVVCHCPLSLGDILRIRFPATKLKHKIERWTRMIFLFLSMKSNL
jgi:hypothetical protein